MVHSVCVFDRLPERTCFAKDFEAAGYFGHTAPREADWQDLHAFCRERFALPHGDYAYSWTGDTFWFLTEEDREAFKTECEIWVLFGIGTVFHDNIIP